MSNFRKQLYYNTLEYFDKFLSLFTKNNQMKFHILYIIHYYFVFMFPIIMIIIYPTRNTLLMDTIFHLVVFLFHLLYNGCILLKIERKYLGTKDWYGLYHLLEIFGITNYKQYIFYYHNMSILFLFIIYILLFYILTRCGYK